MARARAVPSAPARSPRAAPSAGSAAPAAPASRASPRDRILDVAATLFYRHGIRAVGVDTLIAEAGVAKMTFYKHFPSKDALVVTFLHRRDERWRGWLEAAVARRAPAPRARLLAVFDALEEWFASDDFRGCAFVNATVELADRAHPAHAVVAAHKQALARYLRELATAAAVAHPERLSRQLGLLMDGAIVTALREGTPRAAREAREMARRLLASAG